MIITNNKIFTDLTGSGLPELLFTTYDPQEYWDRPELLGAQRGSILVQVGQNGADCYGGDIVAIWYKRSDFASVSTNGGQHDWALMFSLPVSGTVAPDSSDIFLCALPVGSVYVQRTGTNCVDQIYLKVRSNCGAPSCDDWYPMLLNVTRDGSVVEFDAETYTLNLPVGGNLTSTGTKRYLWTPDDGGSTMTFSIPTVGYTEGDNFFTVNPNSGGPLLTVPLGIDQDIPDDVAGVRRPWVKVGDTHTTVAQDVLETDAIWHTGKVARGATSVTSTAADFESRGSTALGAGNHDMTGASNCLAGGDGNIVKNTSNSVVFGGVNNVIDGTANPSTIKNCIIMAGANNRVDAPNAGVLAGNSHVVSGNAGAVCAGQYNEIVTGTDGNAILTGNSNKAGGGYSAVLGGEDNEATAINSAVLHGRANRAAGIISLASGIQALANHSYTFVFNTDDESGGSFASAAEHEFAVKAIGGFRFITNHAASTGMYMTASTWTAVSDRRLKTDIDEVDADDILEAFADLPIFQFRYRGDERLNIGPMAQDFYAAFGDWVEEERNAEGYLAIADADKTALLMAAVSALLARVKDLEAKVESLENVQ